MINQLKSVNSKSRKAQAYQQELRETGELDYRMSLVKQLQNREITNKEAMEKLKQWKISGGDME